MENRQDEWGIWGLSVPITGTYAIQAYIPNPGNNSWTGYAKYTVYFKN